MSLTAALAIAALPSADAQEAPAEEPGARLDDVVVTGVVERSTSPSQQAAEESLTKVSGAATVVGANKVSSGTASSTADVLANEPGVFAAQAGGNDSIKISIRGSGINRGTGFFRSGVLFTYDGLPVTTPSGTPFELFEPLGLQYTEVLRGGNAFDRGSLALGGAINYVTHTGRTALSPLELRAEGGSFGYYKGQISSGAAFSDFDYYVSITGSHRDGFQDHANTESFRIAANFGYQISEDVETRFFYRYGYTKFQQPGTLTRAQIESDPTQANAQNVLLNAGRTQPGSNFIGNVTTITLSDTSTLSLGASFHDFPIYITGGVAPSDWTYGALSGFIKYDRSDEIFGKRNETTFAFYTATDIYGDVVRRAGREGLSNYAVGSAAPYYRYKGQAITVNEFGGSSDNVLLWENDLELFPNFWVNTGVAGTYIRRKIDITYPVDVSYDEGRYDYLARFGVRYDVTPDFQFYANVTRSLEPRNDWAGVNTPQSGLDWGVADLKEQEAWTGEIGTRFHAGIFDVNLSYYYGRLKNELLTVRDPVTEVTSESNASPTVHQGIELGAQAVLWESKPPVSSVAAAPSGKDAKAVTPQASAPVYTPHRLVLSQTYTWSDFYYRNDPVFGENQLPGIPEHYYFAELRYEHPSGFYAAFNAQAASSYFVDYANSFETKAYAIFGASVGYVHPSKTWEIYVDARNIFDKKYASSVSVGYNDGGNDLARSYPGDGAGIFTGLTVRF